MNFSYFIFSFIILIFLHYYKSSFNKSLNYSLNYISSISSDISNILSPFQLFIYYYSYILIDLNIIIPIEKISLIIESKLKSNFIIHYSLFYILSIFW